MAVTPTTKAEELLNKLASYQTLNNQAALRDVIDALEAAHNAGWERAMHVERS